MTHTSIILRSCLVKSPLIVGATVAALIASATMAPAFTPVVFAPLAFSYMAIQNIQRMWLRQGSYRTSSGRRIAGYGSDSNYGQGGGQYGSEQYRTVGD
jgi:hypothetical protein